MTTDQQADRLAEEAKTWISQVCIAAHRHSPAQTKVAVEALEAFIEALATLARTPSVPDDVAADAARYRWLRGHCVIRVGEVAFGRGYLQGRSELLDAQLDAARASHEGEQHGQ